jgi:hypothetical protein
VSTTKKVVFGTIAVVGGLLFCGAVGNALLSALGGM